MRTTKQCMFTNIYSQERSLDPRITLFTLIIQLKLLSPKARRNNDRSNYHYIIDRRVSFRSMLLLIWYALQNQRHVGFPLFNTLFISNSFMGQMGNRPKFYHFFIKLLEIDNKKSGINGVANKMNV